MLLRPITVSFTALRAFRKPTEVSLTCYVRWQSKLGWSGKLDQLKMDHMEQLKLDHLDFIPEEVSDFGSDR